MASYHIFLPSPSHAQVVRTSVPWRYEVQQVDIFAEGNVPAVEIYFSLMRTSNDTATVKDTYFNSSWPVAGASLLDSETSAADLAAALDSLPSAGKVSVTRIQTDFIADSNVASRHLVTFLSRGGDVPLLKAETLLVTETVDWDGAVAVSNR